MTIKILAVSKHCAILHNDIVNNYALYNVQTFFYAHINEIAAVSQKKLIKEKT